MLNSPGQEIVELPPKVVTIRGASITTRVLIGVTIKGTIGLGKVTTSWEDWVANYGGFTTNGWTAYAAYLIYKGNPGARLYTVRVAHYTTLTDKTTLVAKVATVSLNDRAAPPLANLKVSASSEGIWGNALKVQIADNGATAFDLTVLETVNGADVQRDKFVNVNMDPTDVANYVLNRVNGKGKRLITVTDLLNATPAGATKRPAIATTALIAGDDGLTGLVDGDFTGDAGARSGLYGMNTIQETVAFAIPGKTTSPIHLAAITFCETKKNRYFVGDLPFGMTATAAAAYRTTTLGANSDYAEMNWPHLAIMDPLTSLRKIVPNSAFILAAMGRTFDNPAKGPWKVASGINDGQMLGAIGLETDDVNDQGQRDTVYLAQINPIYFVPNYGICRIGALTLTADPGKYQINQRWTFLYCEQSIKDGTVWEGSENIDNDLFKKAERTIKSFLLTVWRRKGLKGDKPVQAFYVQVDAGNNPDSEISLGNLRHRIGLAVKTATQFQYFEFERDTRALEAEIAKQ